MDKLPNRVLDNIRRHELLKPGDRVGVAVSGGADSVGLLRLLLELRKELGIALSVVHFNHKLRGAESEQDERFVTNLAHCYKLPLHASGADVAVYAVENRMSLEAAARELRYTFFRGLLVGAGWESESRLTEAGCRGKACMDKIATGHTLDDQAETVLMRVIRGTGMRGLGGIHPRLEVERDEAQEPAEIVRPLLAFRRNELEKYLQSLRQPWREDATNQQLKYTRNRVRLLLLPLLEREFNPAVVENLTELADIARAEEEYWENEASGWMGTGVRWFHPEGRVKKGDLVRLGPVASRDSSPADASKTVSCGTRAMDASVSRIWLLAQPQALQRRVIKSVAECAGFPLEYKHINEILQFAAEEAGTGKQLALPLGWKVEREGDALLFLSPAFENVTEIQDYEYRLSVPGEVAVLELGVWMQAIQVIHGTPPAEYNTRHLFDPALLSRELTVRNWRPGDRFWPAHTKSCKKIKELLQQRHITGAERRLWPVVLSGDEIVWLRGFAAPTKFQALEGSTQAVLIRERPVEES